MRRFKRLPEDELEVMEALWDCETPAPRTAIEDVLYPRHQISPTALLTMLTRLSDKGYISIFRDGRKYFYAPLVTREAYLGHQSGRGREPRSRADKPKSSFFSSFMSTSLSNCGINMKTLNELSDLLKKDGY